MWYNGKFSKEDVALYSALASNRDKKEDPIDRSVINHFDKLFGPEGIIECSKFTKVRGVGFNPIYKRVVFEFTHPTLGTPSFFSSPRSERDLYASIQLQNVLYGAVEYLLY